MNWVAWPLPADALPQEHFVARPHDADEEFSFRIMETRMPSSDLQEELCASILRQAKRKFRKRQKKWSAVQPSVEVRPGSPFSAGGSRRSMEQDSQTTTISQAEPMSTGIPDTPASGKLDTDDDEEDSDDEEIEDNTVPRSGGEPVFSADDEASYRLLEPSARHILSNLDSTLQVLHHTRATRQRRAPTDDGEPVISPWEAYVNERSRRILRETLRRKLAGVEPTQPKRPGRPAMSQMPMEGESHDDMILRLARNKHHKAPRNTDAEFEKWYRQGTGVAEPEQNSPPDTAAPDPEEVEKPELNKDSADKTGEENDDSEEGSSDEEESGEEDDDTKSGNGDDSEAERDEPRSARRRTDRRRDLQDWSDVIGAASLAGFPSDVIARTTKRCANLFGESMIVNNLHELPASKGPGIVTAEYRPQPIQLSDSEAELPSSSSEEGEDHLELEVRRRSFSRRSSRALGSSVPRTTASRSPSTSRQGRRLQSKSPGPRSRSGSAGAIHLCPVLTCERSWHGFSRKQNLKRHMELVHKGEQAPLGTPDVAGLMSDVDSEDETYGAIHVDGFLRPLDRSIVSSGRGMDQKARKKRKRPSHRRLGNAGSIDGDSDEEESSN